MSEFRKDLVTGQWVIIASERGTRPSDFHVEIDDKSEEQCPFCTGFEKLTPVPVLELKHKHSNSWLVRVVPNKYPALRQSGSNVLNNYGIYAFMDGYGTHEVIIETPLHNERMTDFTPDHLSLVLNAYRKRLMALSGEPRFKYILIFKNYGHEAGSSLKHSHSQIIAMPILPQNVHNKITGAKRFYKKNGQCVYCHIIRHEQADRVRVINENEAFIAIAPYASRVPFETLVLPKDHHSCFASIANSHIDLLAEILKTVLVSYDKAIENPPFNLIVHTAVHQDQNSRDYHWHLEIMPKLSTLAGFELGSGFFINTTSPEMAASLLRQHVLN